MVGLIGKVIVVTGSARGIGAATSRELARQGAQVVVTARALAGAAALAHKISNDGGKAIAFQCDVADRLSVERMATEVQARFGRIDALINNAGIMGPIGHIADGDPNEWVRAVQINLIGPYLCSRAVIPLMLRAGGGTIINLSSGAASRPLEGWSAYCATKAGLAMLTRAIDLEYGAAGIISIGYSPGVVDTSMQGAIRESGMNPISQLPKTSLTDPEEPAHVLAHLCTDFGRRHAGKELDARDATFRKELGLRQISPR